MGKNLIEFPIEGGGTMLVETDLEARGSGMGMEEVALPEGLATKAVNTLQASLQKLKPLTATIMDTLRDLNKPDELSVEFGVTLSAASGVVLTSVSGNANLKITMKWKNS